MQKSGTTLQLLMGVIRNVTTETVPPHAPISEGDLQRLETFIERSKKLFVLTGAGVSTESGMKDYRSERVGLFATSDQRPVNYSNFLSSSEVRRRYWARNAAAWPMFKTFRPNAAHRHLASLEHRGQLHWLVTQNVDNLHLAAGSRRLTELHGTVFAVVCLQCQRILSRDTVQESISQLNPGWSATPQGFAPDADVSISQEDVRSFKAPSCEECGGILKPDVVFFGGSIPRRRVAEVNQRLAECDAMIIAGSSIETYSALRHVVQAKERGLPILILNIGRSRADSLASVIVNARVGEAFELLSLRTPIPTQ